MALEDELRALFAQQRTTARAGIEEQAARARRRAINRAALMGRTGSPIQEFTTGEIERGTASAIGQSEAEIAGRETQSLLQARQIAMEEERYRQEKELAEKQARRRRLLGSILSIGGGIATGAVFGGVPGALLAGGLGGLGAIFGGEEGAGVGAQLGGGFSAAREALRTGVSATPRTPAPDLSTGRAFPSLSRVPPSRRFRPRSLLDLETPSAYQFPVIF